MRPLYGASIYDMYYASEIIADYTTSNWAALGNSAVKVELTKN